MKKMLSFILIIVMVLGLSVSAFADLIYQDSYTNWSSFPSYSVYPYLVYDNYPFTSSGRSYYGFNIYTVSNSFGSSGQQYDLFWVYSDANTSATPCLVVYNSDGSIFSVSTDFRSSWGYLRAYHPYKSSETRWSGSSAPTWLSSSNLSDFVGRVVHITSTSPLTSSSSIRAYLEGSITDGSVYEESEEPDSFNGENGEYYENNISAWDAFWIKLFARKVAGNTYYDSETGETFVDLELFGDKPTGDIQYQIARAHLDKSSNTLIGSSYLVNIADGFLGKLLYNAGQFGKWLLGDSKDNMQEVPSNVDFTNEDIYMVRPIVTQNDTYYTGDWTTYSSVGNTVINKYVTSGNSSTDVQKQEQYTFNINIPVGDFSIPNPLPVANVTNVYNYYTTYEGDQITNNYISYPVAPSGDGSDISNIITEATPEKISNLLKSFGSGLLKVFNKLITFFDFLPPWAFYTFKYGLFAILTLAVIIIILKGIL